MSKAYLKRRPSSKKPSRKPADEAAAKGLSVQLPLERDELVTMIQDSSASFATEMGLRLAVHLLEDDVTRRCGPRYERRADRTKTRQGHQPGVITMAGQKLLVRKKCPSSFASIVEP